LPDEPYFGDATLILNALMDIREDVQICRAILEDDDEELEEDS
jgi:hypothetical protein